MLFVPKGYKPEVPAPLVLMFHGAGGTGLGVSYTFTVADDLGIIVLAPDSRDEATWDFLVHGYGEDVEFIGAALQATPTRAATSIASGWRSPATPTAPRTRCRSASAPATRSARSWRSRPA